MFIEIRTTLNTVVAEHREILKLLHQVGFLEEDQIRATFTTPNTPQLDLSTAKDEVANGDKD